MLLQKLEQVHQDHVLSVPNGFENIASTTLCPCHGFVRFSSSSPPETSDRKELLKQIQIFSLQGHPEFTSDIVKDIIDVRETRGVLSRDFSAESRERASQEQEGVSIGRTILEILGA